MSKVQLERIVKKYQNMKYQNIIITMILLFCFTNTYSQSKLKFAERLIYGTSLNYDKNSYLDITTVDFSWHNNLAVNITPALYFGLAAYWSIILFGTFFNI